VPRRPRHHDGVREHAGGLPAGPRGPGTGGAPPRLMPAPAPPRRASRVAGVRLVIARCSVDYAGRLSAHLSPAVRLLMVKAARRVAGVRWVMARCSEEYAGRRSAHLPPAVRLLMVKADGTVSIHADDRAYKPLNWMSPPCRLEEAPGVWRVVNNAGEQLRITL